MTAYALQHPSSQKTGYGNGIRMNMVTELIKVGVNCVSLYINSSEFTTIHPDAFKGAVNIRSL